MPIPDNISYFNRRAHEERNKAEGCEDSSVARVHLAFANEYDRRARMTALDVLPQR